MREDQQAIDAKKRRNEARSAWGLFLFQAESALAQSLTPLSTDAEIRGATLNLAKQAKKAIKGKFGLMALADAAETRFVLERLLHRRNRLLLTECDILGVQCVHRVAKDADPDGAVEPTIDMDPTEVKRAQSRVIEAQMWAHVELFDRLVAPIRGKFDRPAVGPSIARSKRGWLATAATREELGIRDREAERVRVLEAEEREHILLERAKDDAGGVWGNSWASRAKNVRQPNPSQRDQAVHAGANSASREGEEGIEALQRLYQEACSDNQGCGAVCAKLLVGLYNGSRYRFDLTMLRQLPASLLADALAAIKLDAMLTRQVDLQHLEVGDRKFRDLIQNYAIEVIEKLRESSDGD